MKKNLLILLFALNILVGQFYATSASSRAVSMGNTGNFIHDISNVNIFSGRMFEYSNFALININSPNNYDTYNFYSGLKLSENSSISLFLNKSVPERRHMLANDYSELELELEKQTELYYSHFNGNSAFSFGLIFAGDSKESINSNGIGRETIRDFGLRLGFSKTNFDLDARFHFLASSHDKKYTNVNENLEVSGKDIAIATRFFNPISEKVNLVLFSSFAYQKLGIENDNDYSSYVYNFNLGFSANYKIDENSMIVLAVYGGTDKNGNEVVSQNVEKYNQNILFPAISFGGETNVTSWFKVRFGVIQVYSSESELDYDEDKSTEYTNTFISVFGFGLEKNNFKLDFVLNDGLLFNGPEFISGSSERLSHKLTMTYNF